MSAEWWTTIVQSLGGTADQIDLARHCDRLEAVVTDQGHRLDALQHRPDLARHLANGVTDPTELAPLDTGDEP